MAKRSNITNLVPTPPSSSKPKPRSGSVKRRIVRSVPNANENSSNDAAQNRYGNDHAQSNSLYRQLSFSKYDVIPPISANDDRTGASYNARNRQIAAIDRRSSVETLKNEDSQRTGMEMDKEKVTNTADCDNRAKDQKMLLYRKGDIFRSKATNLPDERECRAPDQGLKYNSDRDTSLYKCPSEPDIEQHDSICLAFRLPGGERIQRYFSNEDRLGDVMVFLQGSLTHQRNMNELNLFTNEVPTKKLIDLEKTLLELGIKSRMILNLIIDDE